MRNLKLLASHLTSKKVPALSLVLIATVGMVAGVLAATMVVTQNTRSGEGGTYHNNTGLITYTDGGLAVAANTISSNITNSFTWGATGTNKQVYNAITAGDWFDYFTFSTTLTDSSTHVATITIRDGSGALGTTLVTATTGTWTGPGGSSTATVTVYVDLGSQTLTAP